MTSTLRRLVCATTVHDEQSDISVQCARCNRWRPVLKEDLKSNVRSGNPPKFNCGLQFGWSCNVPQDPDAQPLYHGTINLPTNLAIQIPAILSLPPVSPDLDQPNVTLTLSDSQSLTLYSPHVGQCRFLVLLCDTRSELSHIEQACKRSIPWEVSKWQWTRYNMVRTRL